MINMNNMNSIVSPVDKIAERGAAGMPARKGKGMMDFAEELTGAQAAAQALTAQGAQPVPSAITEISPKAMDEAMKEAGLKEGSKDQAGKAVIQNAKPSLVDSLKAPTISPAISSEQMKASLAQAAGAQARPEGKSLQELLSGNAGSPLANLKSAHSMNAATALAGLKPGSRDWVFEGADQNPDLQTLIPETPALNAQTEGKITLPEGMESLSARGDAAISQAGDPLSQQLSSQLNSMNGAVIEMRSALGEASEEIGAGKRAPVLKGATASASLSGAEFLGTLSALRGESGDSAAFTGGDSQSGSQGKSLKSPALRVLEGGSKSKKLAFDSELDMAKIGQPALAGVGANAAISDGTQPVKAKELTGHVIQGAMARERLSSESLTGLSGGIRELSTQGGGEIRVRLNPDNLGELHLKVVTRGDQVGLTIQATDEKAKKVIEESLSHLKDSLAGHRLTLSQVDVTTAPTLQQNASAGDHRDSQSQAQNQQFGDLMGMNQRNGQNQKAWDGENSRGSDGGSSSLRSNQVGASSGMSANRARTHSSLGGSRLDVMA